MTPRRRRARRGPARRRSPPRPTADPVGRAQPGCGAGHPHPHRRPPRWGPAARRRGRWWPPPAGRRDRRNHWSAWWPGPSPRPVNPRMSPRTPPRAGPYGRCRARRSPRSPGSCPNRSARSPHPPHNWPTGTVADPGRRVRAGGLRSIPRGPHRANGRYACRQSSEHGRCATAACPNGGAAAGRLFGGGNAT